MLVHKGLPPYSCVCAAPPPLPFAPLSCPECFWQRIPYSVSRAKLQPHLQPTDTEAKQKQDEIQKDLVPVANMFQKPQKFLGWGWEMSVSIRCSHDELTIDYSYSSEIFIAPLAFLFPMPSLAGPCLIAGSKKPTLRLCTSSMLSHQDNKSLAQDICKARVALSHQSPSAVSHLG